MQHDEASPNRPGGRSEESATHRATNDMSGVRGAIPGGLVGWAHNRGVDRAGSGREDRLDTVARALASSQPRRRILAGLAGGVAGVFGLAHLQESEAFICRQPGVLCGKDAQCCSQMCDPETHRCLAGAGDCGPQGPYGCQGCQGPQGPYGCQGPQGPQGD